MSYPIPEKFLSRMAASMPQEEFSRFRACLDEPPVKAVRVNTLKVQEEDYAKISSFLSGKTPFSEDSYYTACEKIGSFPQHFAGLLYSQEPTASSAAPKLDIRKGEIVLDLCSAPGGKGTQAAAYLQGTGLIVLNEPVPSRAQILLSNVERMGIKNAVVLNEYPDTLADFFGEFFDKILVDAPCSGEGMFRKYAEEARKEWSEDNVALCAKRQKEILSAAARMLKNGGRLVYSTCTFSPDEDENQAADFLRNHPEFSLVSEEKFLPHEIKGEGHFVAVFRKNGGETQTCKVKRLDLKKRKISPQAERAYRAFEKDFFKTPFVETLFEGGGALYALPNDAFDWGKLRLLRAGVKLGEMKGERFEPSHALCMCVKKEECKNVVDYPSTDERIERFLRGETICDESAKNGWLVVCADGFPIGLGKGVNGVIKNHIPKGLRKLS